MPRLKERTPLELMAHARVRLTTQDMADLLEAMSRFFVSKRDRDPETWQRMKVLWERLNLAHAKVVAQQKALPF